MRGGSGRVKSLVGGPVLTPQRAAKSRAKHSGTVARVGGGGDLRRGAGCSPTTAAAQGPRTDPRARKDTGEGEDRAELKTPGGPAGHKDKKIK